jgi:hypothetical protein
MSETKNMNPTLAMPVKTNSEIKQFLVNYAGEKLSPENDEVTVDMIAQLMATEFPEFLLAVAEENFLRGYELGLEDATTLETKTNTNNGTKS